MSETFWPKCFLLLEELPYVSTFAVELPLLPTAIIWIIPLKYHMKQERSKTIYSSRSSEEQLEDIRGKTRKYFLRNI